MKSLKWSCAFLLVLFSPALVAQVKVEDQSGQIAVSIDGKPFTALQKGIDANKPYFAPILTASGKHVTRGFPMETIAGEPTDHPHQRGLWLGTEHLSGMNFWELDSADPHPLMGKILFRKVLETHDGERSGGFTIAAQWLEPDGKAILDETLTATFYADPEKKQQRVFDIDLRLKANKTATFEDARDGVIGIRLAPGFDESRGGKLRSAEGVEGAAHLEGTHAHWADWVTNLDGEEVGVTIMEHPTNHRAPTTWIARPYCLLFANPFAQRYYDKSLADGAMTLQPGDELRLRYRVAVHPAGTDLGKLYRAYTLE